MELFSFEGIPITNTPQQETRSSIENDSGIRIVLSRVQGALSDGSDPAQYEYVLLKGSERVGALGLSGGEDRFQLEPRREWTYSLDMTHVATLKSMLETRFVFKSAEGDFEFLCSLAHGLLFSAQEGGESSDDVRYIAITTPTALAGAGIFSTPREAISSDGTVVLAEIFIPGTAT
ncbi:hypothetical protein [Stenotrophomonas sp. JAI102]|uniref:hypothetical protein n=1 Tax=Stenotrophomonas sp. JAI102 TaxID=2723077 RepID=UPI0015C8F839|nr:hypothetical protein [Stenotrophomonas sp. JAI102]NYF37698.1 hypothetical protein [Stenotrophomonas sp. JAI102]